MRLSHTEAGAGPVLGYMCHARYHDSVFCFLPYEQQLFRPSQALGQSALV